MCSSVMRSDCDTHNPFTARVGFAMADEIIFAASKTIENHNDRDLDIIVELTNYPADEFDREFDKICRIEYVGSLTKEDRSNVGYMFARSLAAKRNFNNLEIDYRSILDHPGIKKLRVELRKFSVLQHHLPHYNFADNYSTLDSLYEQDQGFRDHLGQKILEATSPNLVELVDDDDDIDDMRDSPGSNSLKHHQNPRRSAKEPEEYAGQVKKCPRCFSVNVKFKYLNNKKVDQPRYLCLSCNTQFTFGGKVVPVRADLMTTSTCLGDITTGFDGDGGVGKTMSRKRKAQEPERFVDLKKECPNCHSEDAEFKYLNNRKEDQPRYKCLNCKLLYQFPPKRTRLINTEKLDDLPQAPARKIPEQAPAIATASAVIKGINIVTESSTLHSEQHSQLLALQNESKVPAKDLHEKPGGTN